jgi:hypothetical protein
MTMKYEKPAVNRLANATEAIQGSSSKSMPTAPEVLNGPDIATKAAYEADE